MGFLGRSKSSAALSASYGAPQSPACAMPVPRLAPLEHPHASLSRGARPVWDVLDNAEPFECPSSSFSRPRSRRDARSDLAEDLARASLHSASSDGLSRGSGGRLSISTAATSVSARSRSGSVASLGGVSTSSGWSSSTRSIRSCPAVDDEDGLRSPSSPSVSTMRRDSVPTRTRALSDAAARPPTRRSSDRPTTPPVPPLPSSSQSVRRPSTRELEAAVAFDGLSAPERPADVFQRWQPVTVAFDAKPRSRRTGDAAPAPLTETKLRRAIIVEQIDAHTYSVRLVPKGYSHDDSQYYRWHWNYGRRELAIAEGRRAHEDPDSQWTLVPRVPTERLTRASRRIKLPS